MRRERRDKPMHRTTITDAALLTTLLFNTVFKMPPGDGLFKQIFGAGMVFAILLYLIECAGKGKEKKR